jgi:hypothetical protein
MDSRDFSPVSREKFDSFKKESGQTADSFDLERSGVKVSVAYTEATQTVKIAIVDKPPFIPDQMVWSFIEAAVKG